MQHIQWFAYIAKDFLQAVADYLVERMLQCLVQFHGSTNPLRAERVLDLLLYIQFFPFLSCPAISYFSPLVLR